MMRSVSLILLCAGLVAACLLGITLSVALQAPAMILLGGAALTGSVVAWRASVSWRYLIPVLLAGGYFFARAAFSPVADLAIEDIFLILGALIVYLLAGLVNATPAVRTSLAVMVVLILCLHLGSVVFQLTGGQGYSAADLFTDSLRAEGNELTGMYGYRGSFANFAAIAGMLAACLGIWGRFPTWLRGVFGLLALVALAGACLAQSRSAVIGLAAGGVVLLVLLWMSVSGQKQKIRSKFRAAVVVMGCLALCASIAGGIWVFQSRALQAEGADVMFDSSVRLAYWPMAVDQWADHPLVGAGSRSYSYLCFQYWSSSLDTGEANPEFVHNEYLQTLADYGLVGFILVLGLLGWHVGRGAWHVKNLAGKLPEDGLYRGSNAMALTMAGVVGIVIMAVHVVFDFRTHLLANLLLLVCCLVWVLPVAKPRLSKGSLVARAMMFCLLAGLGLTAIWAGVFELRGGMPLLQNKMADEHGAWEPDAVGRDLSIPNLEKALALAPSYRRHLHLGTLYRLEAETMEGVPRDALLRHAVIQYEAAEKRHPYDPVAKLNLAALHTYFKEYELADEYFKRADQTGASRERWFRIHTKWADMHRQWAGVLWSSGDTNAAAEHYDKAIAILGSGSVHSSDTTNVSFMVVIDHARMLDSLKRFEEADKMFEDMEVRLPVYVINGRMHNIRREMGEHYLRHAKHLWYSRKPEAAYLVLLKARRSYQIHRVVLKGEEDKVAQKGYDEVNKVLKFFKDTGVGQ